MRRVLSAGYIVVVVGHGLIHLMGVIEAYGGDLPQLTDRIGRFLGALWLIAAVLVLTSAGLFAMRNRWWRPITAAAAATSQVVILTSWADAKAGTIVNVLMLITACYGLLATSSSSSVTSPTNVGSPAAQVHSSPNARPQHARIRREDITEP